nr:MAG TPA_asm: hypothetical protein [Caudoviricetes sp.]
MSLNKEIIFGLSFGDDDMVIVPNKNSLSMIRGKDTPYTFSTPIIVKTFANLSFPDSGFIYTITYPDGSSLTVDTDELNLEDVYYPEGTTIEFQIKSSDTILHYIECKYVK